LPDGNESDLGIAGWENMKMGLSFRWEWVRDWNGNEVIEMGEFGTRNIFPHISTSH